MQFAWTELKKEQRADFIEKAKQEAAQFLATKRRLQVTPLQDQRTVQKGNSHSEN